MVLEGCYCKKPIELLTQEEKETIHDKSLEILKETGIVFKWEPALTVLKNAGCNVDFESQVVKFPRDIVTNALKSCPNSFTVRARESKYDIRYAANRVHFTNQCAPFMYDFDTGVKRQGTLGDIAKITIIIDALENVDSVFFPLTYLSDRPPEVHNEWILAEAIRNSTKSQLGSGINFSARWIIEIAKVVGVELLGNGTCEPPLTYAADQTDGLMRYAEAGWGYFADTGVQSGASGPATLAGTVLQLNTELLAGLVLQQVINPGTGYMWGTEAMPMDMRNGMLAIGIEEYMIASAAAGMARLYDLPCGTFDSLTGGKLPTDQQVGYEKMMASLLLAQSGVSYIIGGGGIDDETCFSFEQLLIDNEMYSMIARFLRGITVNEETLAADLIKKVGPIPGNYLKEPHTRKWWREEQFLPTLNYRLTYDEWVQDGAKDVAVRAKEQAKEILRTHEVPPLPDDMDKEISKILKAAEEEKVK